jgi:hypothetical protein
MGSWPIAVLLTVCLAQATSASTLFYARGEGSDLVGRQAIPPLFYDESTAVFRIQGTPADVLDVTVREIGGQPWHVLLYGPSDGPIVPGTYESDANDPFPVLVVNATTQSCDAVAARVTVHAIEFDGTNVTALTIDFEQHCSDDPASGLYGSVRFRTGSVACGGVPEGTPCNDFDACTDGATCTGGECVPVVPREPCPSDAQCFENGVCDPLSGACSPTVPATGTPCDDANACTEDDACHMGRCTGTFLTCDDQSPCTTDTCDPGTGCAHAPLAEQCWAIAGRTVVRVNASGKIGGRRIRCKARCMAITPEVLLLDGDQYQFADGPVACTSGTFDLADETGRLVGTRRGQTAFEIGNFEQLRLDLLSCLRFQIIERRRMMKIDAGGASLAGRVQTRARMTQAIPTRVAITTEFNGLPYDPAALPVPPPAKQILRNCEDGLPAQCRFDLQGAGRR